MPWPVDYLNPALQALELKIGFWNKINGIIERIFVE
jgi:hypothetical protein